MNLPAPKTRAGWMLSLALISLSFLIYYGIVFKILSDEYSDNFWQPSVPLEKGNINIDVKIPRYISEFAAREITIRAKNNTNAPQDGFSLIIAAGEIKQNDMNDVCVTWSKNTDRVFFCPSPNVNSIGCTLGDDVDKYDGKFSNIVSFDSIPPHGQVVRTVWVGGGQSKDGDDKVDFGFWETSAESLGTNESGGEIKSESDKCLQFGLTSARFSSAGTFLQSFLRTLLLPPWSNGLIPALVLFVVYTTESKIQPKKNITKIQPKKNITKLPPFSQKVFFSDVIKWLKAFFPNAAKWFTCDTPPRTFVACCHFYAFGLVALLYFSIAIFIVSLPLFCSHWIGGTDGTIRWLSFSIFGVIFIVFSKIKLGKCEPTDLKDDDPMCRAADAPSKPIEIESDVKETLKKIVAGMSALSSNRASSSALTEKLESGFSSLSDRLQEAFIGLTDASAKSQAPLVKIQQTLEDMHVLLGGLSKPQTTLNKHSLADYPFNFHAILVDPEPLRLFVEALEAASVFEFNERLENAKFCLNVFSLLAVKGDISELTVSGNRLIDLLAASNIFETPYDDKESTLEKWLNEADPKYIPKLMDLLLTKKRSLAEKYLFEIDLKKCDAFQVIPLLSKYITQKQEKGESTDIRWRDLVFYLISLSEKDIPDNLAAEQADTWQTVLYPVEKRSILLYANEMLPLELEEIDRFYSILLKMLCVLPDVFQTAATQIYGYYKEVSEDKIPSEINRFRGKYQEYENNLSGLQADWCKSSTS